MGGLNREMAAERGKYANKTGRSNMLDSRVGQGLVILTLKEVNRGIQTLNAQKEEREKEHDNAEKGEKLFF